MLINKLKGQCLQDGAILMERDGKLLSVYRGDCDYIFTIYAQYGTEARRETAFFISESEFNRVMGVTDGN